MNSFRPAGAFALALLLAIVPIGAAVARSPADTLVVAASAEPRTLDPQGAVAVNDLRIVANVFEGLVRFKRGSLDVEPALAKSWTISLDGLTYRFALREGVRFQDGTPFDAKAVEYTFERMLDPVHPAHNATGPFPLAFTFAPVESVAAVDPLTVEFRLREPYAPLLAALAAPAGSIVSPAAVAKYGADFGRHPVGTGPFRFEKWAANAAVELAAVPGGAATASVKHLVFRPVADARERRAALQSGDADVMMDASPAEVKALAKQGGFRVASAALPHLWFLILNTREGPFSDKRVRQAVNYAIDKRRIVEEVLGGGAEIAGDPVPSAFDWADDKGLKPYPYDPEKARALVRQAGAEGANLSFLVAQDGVGMLDPIGMANAIQRDLKAVGLNAKIQTYDWTTFLANVNPGLSDRADMAEMAWTTSDPDTLPYLALRSGATPGSGGLNAGYYANPAVDKLLEDARRTSDRATRARLYREFQRLVTDDAPLAVVASARESAVARPDVVGLTLEPTSIVLFAGVRKD